MAGRFSAKVGKKNKSTYTVEGETLEEIWTELESNGPDNSDVVGAAETGVFVPSIPKFEYKEDKKKAKKDEVTWTVAAKSGGAVSVEASIVLPKLKSDKKLSPKAKQEWKRMFTALSAHEDKHVAAALKVAKEIAKELTSLRGTGSGKDKDAAIEAAEADFNEKYDKAYTGDAVSDRVQAAHDALDAKGNKFILNVDIK